MAEDPGSAPASPIAPALAVAEGKASILANGEDAPDAGAAETPGPDGEAEDRFRRLILTLPAAVYTTDREGRITLFNERAAALWGRRPEAGKEQWCGSWRIYRPDGTPLPLDQCPMAVALREGRAVEGEEIVVERPDGTRAHVLAHPELLRDGAGEIVGAVNMLVDVTARREAERDQALLAAIVTSSDDAIVSKTLNGVITSWNGGAERLFGYTAAEAVGRPVLMLIPPERQEEEHHILNRIRSGVRVAPFETVRVTKDGRRIAVAVAVSPVRGGDGRVVGASKVVRDVTARKQAERARRESEARYRTFLALSQEGIWRFDLDAPIPTDLPADEQVERMYRDAWLAECNEALARMYGFDRPEAVVGARLGDLMPPEDPANRAYLLAFVENAYRLNDAESHEKDREGNARVFSNTLSGEVEGGLLVRAWGTQRDVTARKAAEEALRQSEAEARRLAAVVARTTSGVVVTDADGRAVWANEAFTRISGYLAADIRGRRPAEVLEGPESDAATTAFVKARVAARAAFSAEILNYRKDRTTYWTRVDASPLHAADGTFEGYVAIQTDVTERKRAEEALRQSEERFRLAADAIAGMVYDWDVPTGAVYRTERLRGLVGVGPEAVPPDPRWWIERVHPEDRERVYGVLGEVLDGGVDGYSMEYRVRHEGGGWAYLWDRGSVVRDAEGRARRVVGSATDVTERKRAEEALRQSEERRRLALDATGIGTWEWEIEADRGTFDDRTREILGVAGEEAGAPGLEGGLVHFIHPDDQPAVAAALAAALDPAGDGRYASEPRIVRADGAVRHVQATGQVFFEGEGHPGERHPGEGRRPTRLVGTVWDVTERKLAERSRAFLADLDRAVRLAVSPEDVLAAALGRVPEAFGADRCSYAEVDPGADQITVLYSSGGAALSGGTTNPLSAFVGPAFAAEAQAGRPVVVPDTGADPYTRDRREAYARIGTAAFVAVPVLRDGRLSALLSVVSASPRRWTPHEVALVEAVAARMGQALERARAEVALRESEERFRLAVSNDALTLFEQDVDLRYVWVYPQHPEFPEANIGKTDAELVPSEGGAVLMRVKRRVLETGEGVRQEVEVLLPDGARWYDLVVEPRRDSGGRITGVAGVALDVTDRKAAEEALRESEARFRELADSAPVLVWVNGLEGCEFVNRAYLDFLGVGDVDVRGYDWAQFIHPEDRDAYVETYLDAAARQARFEAQFRFRRHDGEHRWMLSVGVPRRSAGGGLLGYVGSTVDVTDFKDAEAALRRSEARALLLAETGRLVEQALDYEGALEEIARLSVPGFADWCRVDLLQGGGAIAPVAIAHADPEKVRWGWELSAHEPTDPDAPTGVPNVIRTGQPELYPDIPDEMLAAAARDEEHLRLMREIGFSSVLVAPMRAGGAVTGALTFVHTESGRHFDDADLATAEEIGRRAGAAVETARLHAALRASERQLRLVTDTVPALIAYVDAGQRYRFVNRTYTTWFGVAPEDVVGQTLRDVLGEAAYEAIQPEVEAALAGQPATFERQLPYRDGGHRFIRASYVPDRGADGTVRGYFALILDVTEEKRAEEALRESEERTRLALDAARLGVWAYDPRADRFDVDARVAEIAGLPAAGTLSGEAGFAPVHSDDRAYVAAAVVAALDPAGDGRYEAGFRYVHPGGAVRWAEANGQVFFEGSGAERQAVRLIGTVRDVTLEKSAEAALRESEARFRQLAEALPQIVYTSDPDGRVDYLNRRWFDYTGQPEGTDPATAADPVVHPDDAAALEGAWATAMAEGSPLEAELRLRRHDGAWRWFLTRVVPIHGPGGHLVRWFGASTDIHAQKATEAELAERVAERTAELERSNRELDQFAYIASHDLRAPLRGVDNLATWIAEDAGDLLPPESRRHLGLLQGRVQRLEQLLASLLVYSRAGRTTGMAEPVDTAALVQEVVELLDLPDAFVAEVEGGMPTLVTYRTPLELVFRNLIGNAAKHAGRPDGRVRITAGEPRGPADGAEGRFVEFAVADDGPGIPAEYHERIFGLFQTLRPRDEVEGSGMGLAVVRKTVESLGGTIRVESLEGGGTTFYFTWPRAV